MGGTADLECSFEDFEKTDVIGSGGNADVHRARVTVDGTDRVVALKTPRMANYETVDRDFFDTFVEEAELWNRIDGHDNVVSVLDWGRQPLPWIALEYLEAGNLDGVGTDLSLADRADLFEQLCEGVFHAHRHGITHGDLKPENVLLTRVDGRLVPKVGDWGLAKVLLEHSQSAEGLSLAYSAPEQVDPDAYGSTNDRTDIYQLGALGYELFTGQQPFQTESTAALVSSILNDEPTPPSDVDGTLPAALDGALARAMSKEKADRYESVLYLRDAVSEAVGGGGTEETSTGASSGRERSTGTGQPASSDEQLTFGPSEPGVQPAAERTVPESQPRPEPGTPTDREETDSGGFIDRQWSRFYRPPDALGFGPRSGFRDISFSLTYARTMETGTLKRGALMAFLTALYGLGSPFLLGYMQDVIRSAAVGDGGAPAVEWRRQGKQGLIGLGVVIGSLFVMLVPTAILATADEALGGFVLLAWVALVPGLIVGYAMTGSVRRTVAGATLKRVFSLRYAQILLGGFVLFMFGYLLTAFAFLTIVGGFFVGFVMMTALAAYAGRRYRDVPFPETVHA